MKKAIIGKKVGMTQIFDETGKVIPVTVVEAGPCVVTQKKTVETDGYVAVQLGFEDVKEAKLTKPEAGHLKKAGVHGPGQIAGHGGVLQIDALVGLDISGAFIHVIIGQVALTGTGVGLADTGIDGIV